MPTYTFLNTNTNKVEEHVMSIMAYDAFKAANPHLKRHFDDAPGFTFNGRTVVGSSGPDSTFKEVLQKIGEKHKGSPLDERVNRKPVKQVKTEQAVKRHREKLAARAKGR